MFELAAGACSWAPAWSGLSGSSVRSPGLRSVLPEPRVAVLGVCLEGGNVRAGGVSTLSQHTRSCDHFLKGFPACLVKIKTHQMMHQLLQGFEVDLVVLRDRLFWLLL